MLDLGTITTSINQYLHSVMPTQAAVLVECILVALCAVLAYVMLAIVMIFMERKVCAAFQCRLGPMRVGVWGLLQVFADVFKMLIKEI